VSLQFNLLGKNKRTSLRALTKIFLNEDIQADAKRGHSSVEDSLATLKLLQLKLQHG
jgi:RNA exonuclease 1